MNVNSVDEILDFAIQKEEEAAQFYTELAERMERPAMRLIFGDFAQEEVGHKKKLQAIKVGNIPAPMAKKVVDLKIGDYVIDIEPGPNLEYQEALIIAMKKEKAAFKLYNDLAALTDDENLRSTFLLLAQEEAKHKLRFEIEYDDYILTEN